MKFMNRPCRISGRSCLVIKCHRVGNPFPFPIISGGTMVDPSIVQLSLTQQPMIKLGFRERYLTNEPLYSEQCLPHDIIRVTCPIVLFRGSRGKGKIISIIKRHFESRRYHLKKFHDRQRSTANQVIYYFLDRSAKR